MVVRSAVGAWPVLCGLLVLAALGCESPDANVAPVAPEPSSGLSSTETTLAPAEGQAGESAVAPGPDGSGSAQGPAPANSDAGDNTANTAESDAATPDASDASEPDAAKNAAEPDGFTRIFEEILQPRHCDSYLCHGAYAGGLDLTSEQAAYEDLVNAPATGLDCVDGNYSRVIPGEPDGSLLYIKLLASPPCGDEMPPSPTPLLPEGEIEAIRQWILGGALP
ncbi:MAG: hypothetical protein OEZ06_25390 [Myxococcales bacterium]|nr:hypothetical protein [Myxococcales bacterium]